MIRRVGGRATGLSDEWQSFDVPWTALQPGFGDFEICVDDVEVY